MARFKGGATGDYYAGTEEIDLITGADGRDRLSGGGGADRVSGGAGNDILSGNKPLVDFNGAFLPAYFDATADQDRLDGGDGDDVIGGGYNDIVLGGAGLDTLFLDLTAADRGVSLNFAKLADGGLVRLGSGRISGIEKVGTIFATAFDDVVRLAGLTTGATLGDHVDGGAGNDVIDGRALASEPGGTPGDDVIIGGAYRLSGGAGDDQLFGSDFADRLAGGDGDDRLVAGLGRDDLSGGAGDDVIDLRARGYSGSKQADGGEGDDLVQVLGVRARYEVFLNADGEVILYRDYGDYDEEYTLSNVERVQFSDGIVAMSELLSGNLIGTDDADTIGPNDPDPNGQVPGDGADTLFGLAGDDVLDGGRGADTFYGGEGADTFVIDDAGDQIMDAEFADTIISSVDTTRIDDAEDVGRIQLVGTGDINAFSYGAGTIIGNDGDNRLTGSGVLEGGRGDDVLYGSYLATASYEHADAAVRVSLAINGAQDTRGAGTDTLEAIRHLRGSDHDDLLIGDRSDNTIEGGAGHDRLRGGLGIDTLDYTHAAAGVTVNLSLVGVAQDTGGAGRDTIWDFEFIAGSAHADVLIGDDGVNGNYIQGRDGDDVIIGRGGMDTLRGGEGADTFVYDAVGAGDWIMDFGLGGDRIDLSAIDANVATAGDQAFRIVAAFTGAAGELVVTQPFDSSGQMMVDVDGDGQSDLTLLFYSTIPDDIGTRITL